MWVWRGWLAALLHRRDPLRHWAPATHFLSTKKEKEKMNKGKKYAYTSSRCDVEPKEFFFKKWKEKSIHFLKRKKEKRKNNVHVCQTSSAAKKKNNAHIRQLGPLWRWAPAVYFLRKNKSLKMKRIYIYIYTYTYIYMYDIYIYICQQGRLRRWAPKVYFLREEKS